MKNEKAIFFYREISRSDFLARSGWLDKFKKRHKVRLLKMCGEKVSRGISFPKDGQENKCRHLKSRHFWNNNRLPLNGILVWLTSIKQLELEGVQVRGNKKTQNQSKSQLAISQTEAAAPQSTIDTILCLVLNLVGGGQTEILWWWMRLWSNDYWSLTEGWTCKNGRFSCSWIMSVPTPKTSSLKRILNIFIVLSYWKIFYWNQ